jgi:hypothetical protein
MSKQGFITEEGVYYESMTQINASDAPVPLRPSEDDVFTNGTWISNRRASRQQQFDFQTQPTVREIPQPASQDSSSRDINTYRIGEDTQFKFKLKDIVIVVAFIVSIAISWNNSDTRMTRTEEKLSQLKSDLVQLKSDLSESMKKNDELWRRQEDMNRTLSQQIFNEFRDRTGQHK